MILAPVFRVRLPLRALVVLGVLALLAIALAVMIARFVYPDRADEYRVGALDDFVPGSVATFWKGDDGDVRRLASPAMFGGSPQGATVFHIVRLPDGALLAFSAEYPHPRGCKIQWMPSLQLQDRRGWFQDPCLGAIWDMNGRRAYGPAPRDMDRFAVRVTDGEVTVDLRRPEARR